jgi:hypothetical protein
MRIHVVPAVVIDAHGMCGCMFGCHGAPDLRSKQHGRASHATHRQGYGEQQHEKNADYTRHDEKLSIG